MLRCILEVGTSTGKPHSTRNLVLRNDLNLPPTEIQMHAKCPQSVPKMPSKCPPSRQGGSTWALQVSFKCPWTLVGPPTWTSSALGPPIWSPSDPKVPPKSPLRPTFVDLGLIWVMIVGRFLLCWVHLWSDFGDLGHHLGRLWASLAQKVRCTKTGILMQRDLASPLVILAPICDPREPFWCPFGA